MVGHYGAAKLRYDIIVRHQQLSGPPHCLRLMLFHPKQLRQDINSVRNHPGQAVNLLLAIIPAELGGFLSRPAVEPGDGVCHRL